MTLDPRDLRVEAPQLRAPDHLVHQLASLAAAGAARPGRRRGVLVIGATVGALAFGAGGAWATGVIEVPGLPAPGRIAPADPPPGNGPAVPPSDDGSTSDPGAPDTFVPPSPSAPGTSEPPRRPANAPGANDRVRRGATPAPPGQSTEKSPIDAAPGRPALPPHNPANRGHAASPEKPTKPAKPEKPPKADKPPKPAPKKGRKPRAEPTTPSKDASPQQGHPTRAHAGQPAPPPSERSPRAADD